jgi:hypothetical protein
VRGQVRADDLGPPAEHRAHRGPLLPAVRVEQAADGAGQRLRVLLAEAAASGRSGRATVGTGGYPAPFVIVVLVWPQAEAGRPEAAGPRVRPGYGERLDRQPDPVVVPCLSRHGGRRRR